MTELTAPKGWLPSRTPGLYFEDNGVGRMKKTVWDSTDAEIDAILAEYGRSEERRGGEQC